MTQAQIGPGPDVREGDADPVGAGAREAAVSPPARFVGWLGGLGGAVAGYGVFQFLFEVLPDTVDGQLAKYLIAGVSGLGTAVAGWLAAGLVRARGERPGRPADAPAAPAAVPRQPAPGPLQELCAATYAAIAEQTAVVEDPVCGRLVGWSHVPGDSDPGRPTPTGTAYGLHIVLELGVPEGRLSAGDLVDTLWRLRLPDGGWSARTQGFEARPEVTALVLGALARAGVPRDRLADEVALCEARFTHAADRAGRESTHVLTTVMRGLLRAAPHSAALPVLREALLEGALDDERRSHLRCWGYRLDDPYGRPSPVHTAQAVVALERAAAVLGENAAARGAREDAVRWLLACPEPRHDVCRDLANLREEIRRPRSDDPAHHEVLNVRHFTATWLIRALLLPGAQQVAREDGLMAQWRERLDGAAAAVWAAQNGGVWMWAQGEGYGLRQPMWMAYQGLSALRAHAVWMYRPDH